MPPKRKINANQDAPLPKKLKRTTVRIVPLFSYGENQDVKDPIEIPIGSEIVLGRGPPLHLPNKKISRQQLRIHTQNDLNQQPKVTLSRIGMNGMYLLKSLNKENVDPKDLKFDERSFVEQNTEMRMENGDVFTMLLDNFPFRVEITEVEQEEPQNNQPVKEPPKEEVLIQNNENKRMHRNMKPKQEDKPIANGNNEIQNNENNNKRQHRNKQPPKDDQNEIQNNNNNNGKRVHTPKKQRVHKNANNDQNEDNVQNVIDPEQEERDRLLALQFMPQKCAMCLDDVDVDFLQELTACHHKFCRDCLQQYVTTKINDRQFPIQCPAIGCKKEIVMEDLEILLSPQLFDKYQKQQFKFVVEKNPDNFMCCPTADCDYVFFFDPTDSSDFRCPTCKKRYCFRCKVEYHVGSTCEQYQKWSVDNGLANDLFGELVKGGGWKQCRKCKAWISKTEGCNHMTCRCGCEFCYKCGGKWPCKNCREFSDDEDEDEDDDDGYRSNTTGEEEAESSEEESSGWD